MSDPKEEIDGPGDDEDEDEDDDLDEDDDDEDEESEAVEDDEDGETTPDEVARDIAAALRDAHEGCASAIAEKKRILLDLDDDSRWLITVKRRD